MNQIYYSLQVDAISAGYDIRINDIPVYADPNGNPVSVEFPINHFLITGLNILQVSISPAKHETEFVNHSLTEFKIYSREISDLTVNRKLIASAKFPDYINNEKLKKAVIPSKTEFTASLLLDTPVWSTAPVLKLNEETINEALGIYKEFFNALKSKNLDAILKLTQIKNKVFADCFYTSLNNNVNRVRDSIKGEFDDSFNHLTDFDIQKKIPELHAFGKLVSIKNDEGRSPLYFYNSETGISTEYEIYLCRKDKKLTIVL